MMTPVQTGVLPRRRSLDLSRRQRPLRIAIGRRRTRSRAGEEKFVTQVRLGEAEAIFVPWTKQLDGRRLLRPRPAQLSPQESLV